METLAKETVDPDGIAQTVKAIRDNPALANVTFNVDSEWLGGFAARSVTGELIQAGTAVDGRTARYVMESDEPQALLGSDTAVSPAEYALKALAACYTVTFAANAAVRGIELSSLKLELECDFNLHGFLGLDRTVRPGMQELRVVAHLTSSNASPEELGELVSVVEERSPIRDTFANPVSVITVHTGS